MFEFYWVLLITSSAGFALGTIYLARFAVSGSLLALGIAFSFFAAANLMYAPILVRGIGQGSAMSSMAHLVLMALVGAFMGERLGWPQLAALGLALIALWLFSLTPNGTL